THRLLADCLYQYPHLIPALFPEQVLETKPKSCSQLVLHDLIAIDLLKKDVKIISTIFPQNGLTPKLKELLEYFIDPDENGLMYVHTLTSYAEGCQWIYNMVCQDEDFLKAFYHKMKFILYGQGSSISLLHR